MPIAQLHRRNFLKASCAFPAAVCGLNPLSLSPAAPVALPADDANINVLGPREGYSLQIGTLVSMMIWMRAAVLRSVKGMSQTDLDFLLDDKANRIGALLLHLAASDHYYHLHTFGGMKWGSWSDDEKRKWDIPMQLGDPARNAIKGNNLDYYLSILEETREKTFAEFRKRDDKWLTAVGNDWGGPVNNFCKWFHVCEHESNHNGQIKLIKGRLPGAKPSE
jgi:uncharacterized damage-inducible protein DinB